MATTKDRILFLNEHQNDLYENGGVVLGETTCKEYKKENDEVVVTVISEKEFVHGDAGNLEEMDTSSTSSTPSGPDTEKGQVPIDEKYFGFSDKNIRRGFIRKVYGVLFLQLSLTLGIGSYIFNNECLSGFLRRNFTFFWSMVAIIIVCILLLLCLKEIRRTPPFNLIFLALFTAAEAGLVGTAASTFESREVLIAVGVVTVLSLFLTLFAFQSKYDFTLLFVLMGVIMLVLCVYVCFLLAFPSRKAFFVYSGIIVLMFSVHMVLDTQLMMGGNHFFQISPEEYIVAALNLYMDILNLFLHLLVLMKS